MELVLANPEANFTSIEYSRTLKKYKIEQPGFLLSNWRMLQASATNSCHDYTKHIKALNGVLTINNGNVLIRSFHDVIEDGFYIMNSYDELIRSSPEVFGCKYYFPDVEVLKPDFPSLDRVQIDREEAHLFIDYLNYIRQSNDIISNRTSVILSGEGAIKRKNGYQQDEVLPTFSFSCKLPVNSHRLVFDALNLKIAFTEMLRYDRFFIGYNSLTKGDESPLVMGLDWGRCSLIMPGII